MDFSNITECPDSLLDGINTEYYDNKKALFSRYRSQVLSEIERAKKETELRRKPVMCKTGAQK